MNTYLSRVAVASAIGLSFVGAAHAGSVNQPGFTTGIPVYGDFPEGLFLTAIPEYGVRDTSPNFALSAFTPFFFYQSPLKLGPMNVAVVFSPIFLDEQVSHVSHVNGLYNTYGGVQLTHQFSNGWGAGFRLGGFAPQNSAVAYRFGTFDSRFGVTYLKDGTDFTINGNYGKPIGDGSQITPDYFNLDVTYTKTFKKLELGGVAFASTDLGSPFASYRKQSQIAVGPVVGYRFGKVDVQLKFTSDITQHNYGGIDRRIWANITVPLWVR